MAEVYGKVQEYEVTATYEVRKRLFIRAPEGTDLMNPNNWENIEGEQDCDCVLLEVLNVKVCE